MVVLSVWADRWAQPAEGSPILFVHKVCGHRFQPQVTCSECGQEISADTVTAVGGPGGAAETGTKVLAGRLQSAM
jgi:hypothetical protein